MAPMLAFLAQSPTPTPVGRPDPARDSALPWLFGSPYGYLLYLLQLGLVIHVYRTGRPYYWGLVIFGVPLFGPLIYFVVEILPELRGARGRSVLASLKPRKWRIADGRAKVEESDTVENRLALAAELSEGGQQEEALAVAREAVQGVFKDDAHLIAQVSRYHLDLGQNAEALALVERVKDLSDKSAARALKLAKADALRGLGRLAEAEALYGEMADRYFGEAVRAGLARIYAQTRRQTEAKAIWEDICSKYRRSTPAWRRTEKPWYKLAKAELKASG